MTDLEQSPYFYRKPKARKWEDWVKIVKKTRNETVEFDQGDQWFKTNQQAEEWMKD